ncbi:MAG: glycosyltransferase family 2 protein [Bacteroidetes bacterium]|nr:MAG: glycosyltransferase family 2 protein [Bacteroidota bacterium]
MMDKKKISAVVSVYNEEKTVKNVVNSLINCNFVDELIVVNDGSTDNTSKVLNEISASYSFQNIAFEKNKGKSYAMTTGVEHATGDIIVFVDADLIGFNCEHIKVLTLPLVTNQAKMVIGRRPAENPKTDITGSMDDWLGGERAVYRKDILPILDKMRETKFGVETLLNLYFKSKTDLNKQTIIVDLKGLVHIRKYKKYSRPKAAINYAKATSQIVQTVFVNYVLIFGIIRNVFTNIKL